MRAARACLRAACLAVLALRPLIAQAGPSLEDTQIYLTDELRKLSRSITWNAECARAVEHAFEGGDYVYRSGCWESRMKLSDIGRITLDTLAEGDHPYDVCQGPTLRLTLDCADGRHCVFGRNPRDGREAWSEMRSVFFCAGEEAETTRRRVANAFRHLLALQGFDVEIMNRDKIGQAFD